MFGSYEAMRSQDQPVTHVSVGLSQLEQPLQVSTEQARARMMRLMAGIQGIDTPDRARMLVQIMKLLVVCNGDVEHQAVAPLYALAAVHVQECTTAVSSMHTLEQNVQMTVTPSGVSDALIARALAVLNTNCMEINVASQGMEGSALFTQASRIQHSCQPNASFQTFVDKKDKSLRVAVHIIEPIKAGSVVTIDYLNQMYCSRELRQSLLQEQYDFTCDCSRCESTLDPTRTFDCGACGQGVITIAYSGRSAQQPQVQEGAQCGACKRVCTPVELQAFKNVEKKIIALYGLGDEEEEVVGMDTEEDDANALWYRKPMAVILQDVKPLHPSHYICFTLLEARGRLLLDTRENLQETQAIWEHLIVCVSRVLPRNSDQKCVLIDELAQIRILQNKIPAAKEAYKLALDISNISFGVGHENSIELAGLYTNTPQNAQQMQKAYANRYNNSEL